VHAGVFGDDLDAMAHRMDQAIAARDADYLADWHHDGGVIDLETGEAPAVDLGFHEEPPDGIALQDQIGRLGHLVTSCMTSGYASRYLSPWVSILELLRTG
jgi:hypothetical protein